MGSPRGVFRGPIGHRRAGVRSARAVDPTVSDDLACPGADVAPPNDPHAASHRGLLFAVDESGIHLQPTALDEQGAEGHEQFEEVTAAPGDLLALVSSVPEPTLRSPWSVIW